MLRFKPRASTAWVMTGVGQLRRFGFLLSITALQTACDGCRRDHPFTPFVVSSVTSSATALPEDSGPHDTAPPAVALAQGEKLAPNSREFSLGPRKGEAPASMTVDSVLRADWNDDKKLDAIALMRSSTGDSGSLGSLYFYDGAGDARRLFDLPGWIPSSPDCTWDTRLAQVTQRLASLEVHMHCGVSMPPRSATRFLAVVSPLRPRPLVVGWRLAEPAPDETLDASVKIGDRDGDGTDDITLVLALGVSSGNAQAVGEFTWLDRAAGLSRAAGQFRSSLDSTLIDLDKKAGNRTTASEAESGVGLIWRLLGSACAPAGTARVFAMDGSPLHCDSIEDIVSRLVTTEVRAALIQNDVSRAAFALSKATGALGTSISSSEHARLEKLIAKSCTRPKTITALKTDFSPVSVRSAPHYSPLQFQSDGTLAVMSAKGVVLLNSEGHEIVGDDQDAAPPSPAQWPLVVSAADGKVLEALVPSCDRSEITLLTKSPEGAFQPPSVTSLLAPRPGLCAGATKLNWHISPIRFDKGQPPVLLAEGACVTPDGRDTCQKPSRLGKPELGSPRSPDGNWLVAVTNLGVFVIGGPKPELWDGPDVGNPASLRDCVISNGAQRLACVRESRVWLFSKFNSAEAPTKQAP